MFVHFAVLYPTIILEAPFSAAQLGAAVVASAWNFSLNNSLTFRDRRLSGWGILPGLVKYLGIAAVGIAANVAVATAAFNRSQGFIAVSALAGIAVDAVWKYFMSNLLVWRGASAQAADAIDVYMQDGLLVRTNATSPTVGPERELAAVRDLLFQLIDRGTPVVRSKGSGIKPRYLADELKRRGVRVTARRVTEHLATLELRGVLRYQGAKKNVRGVRAGFVKGPLAEDPLV
jgi:putative flippase GtrA